MIRFQDRLLPLPEVLQACPACKRGQLAWDGQAYRCTDKRCKRGLSLAAIFDVEDIEFRIQCGYAISSLPLTGYALQLLRAGIVEFSWITRSVAQRLYDRLPAEKTEDDHNALDKLMRERQQRREVGA